jgi:hypothetical protein
MKRPKMPVNVFIPCLDHFDERHQIAIVSSVGLGADFNVFFGVGRNPALRNGITSPTDYQVAFLSQYRVAAEDKKVRDDLKNVLIVAGVIAAVILLLNSASKK